MSRKDFIAVADALGRSLAVANLSAVQAESIAREFAKNIAHTNASFKLEVFVRAVMLALSA